jgi:hypothetical protein
MRRSGDPPADELPANGRSAAVPVPVSIAEGSANCVTEERQRRVSEFLWGFFGDVVPLSSPWPDSSVAHGSQTPSTSLS